MALYKASKAYEAQRDLIRLPRTLMGGTHAMRRAGEAFLPKKSAETAEAYAVRLNESVLVNYFSRTVDYLAGQVFQKPVEFQPPSEVDDIKYNEDFFLNVFNENVDLAGNNLSNFALTLFKDGIIDGVTFLMVEYPQTNVIRSEDGSLYISKVDEEGRKTLIPKTEEVDKLNGWQPYFVQILASQVLDAWVQIKDGKSFLSLFAYEEYFERPIDGDDLNREIVQRIRVLRPGSWEMWEVGEETDDKGEKITATTMIDSGYTSLDYVPIFWFMPGSDREDAITADPPLADLAEMNRAYYSAYSNYRDLLKWNSSPIWLAVNILSAKNEPIAVGPSHMISVKTGSDTSVAPSLTSVGVNPEAIAKAVIDLEDMRSFMESYGLQIALAAAGNVTATQVTTVNNASDSQLKGWCVKFADTLENAFKAVSQYESGSLDADGPAVMLNTTFRQSFDANKSALLKSMADADKLTTLTFLRQLKQMGVFGDEFIPEEEYALLQEEAGDRIPSLTNMFKVENEETGLGGGQDSTPTVT